MTEPKTVCVPVDALRAVRKYISGLETLAWVHGWRPSEAEIDSGKAVFGKLDAVDVTTWAWEPTVTATDLYRVSDIHEFDELIQRGRAGRAGQVKERRWAAS